MKKRLSGLIFLVVFISSCCREDSVETARYELSEKELALIPYIYGQQINFTHSNGYNVAFKVIKDTLEWKEYYDFCEFNCCGNDYYSYQLKYTTLESVYPNLHIEFSLGAERSGEYNPGFLNLNINNRHFVSMQYDSLSQFICDTVTKIVSYDSVTINNVHYSKVYEKHFDYHSFIEDSTILVPESIFYNQSGLIQIKMSNNETYSLNN